MAQRTFFIGDVHGRSDLLVEMLDFIGKISSGFYTEPQVVFLGDLVDRGPDSRGALEAVYRRINAWQTSKLLISNHDDMFLEFIEGRMSAAKAKYWLERCGGAETLQSYGQNGESDLAAEAIRSNYHHHINMLRRASSLVRVGGLVACHAGINAWLPIDEQHRHDLMWITDGFLDRVDDRMPPVVHGHTPMGELPVVTENRISIDTEAYETGRLTAFFLDRIERKCAFYQTSKESPVREVTPIFHNRGKGCVLDRADLMTL